MLSRRDFIRNSAMALPAMSLAGFLLSSCRKTVIEPKKTGPRIGIIGAGIAGLEAARILSEQHHCQVEILEAGDRIGGRIHSLENAFGAWPLELGADAAYGQDNPWYRLIENQQPLPIGSGSEASYFIHKTTYSSQEISSDSEFKIMMQKMHDMDGFQSTTDISLSQYMSLQGIPERVRFIFEEMTEEALGTSNERASLPLNSSESLKKMQQTRFVGGRQSHHRTLLSAYGNILPGVITNTAVSAIDYSGSVVKVSDKNQVLREYDHVIVTVPLSILKRKPHETESIQFIPELPAAKREAMEDLGMDSGVRILLRLNKKFWQHEARSFYTGGLIGKFEVVKEDLLSNQFILSATVSGKDAEDILDQMSAEEIVELIRKDWSEHIGLAAANAITGHTIKHWSKDPYIRGTFSYRKVGGQPGSRAELARSLGKRIFFAGEACHSGAQSGTVGGAMETAKQAAAEIANLYA